MGWDVEGKKLVSRGFSIDGTSTHEWTKFANDKWEGHGIGTGVGVEWDSPATLELKKDWRRYEDIADGKPWIGVWTRKAKTESPAGVSKGTVTRADGSRAKFVVTGSFSEDSNTLNVIERITANGEAEEFADVWHRTAPK